MQVVAIMGPSGAGKSTLLYALMGTARYGATRGRLWINSREMRLARLRRILGYVPQVPPAAHIMASCAVPYMFKKYGPERHHEMQHSYGLVVSAACRWHDPWGC